MKILLILAILKLFLLNYSEAGSTRNSKAIKENKARMNRFLLSNTTSDGGVEGNHTVLVLRVIGLDSVTSASSEELSDYIFGTYGKPYTMTSQFSACSYNKFNVEPFVGKVASSQILVTNGVLDLELSMNVINEAAAAVADLALTTVESLIGPLRKRIDFLMICLPPGTLIGTSADWQGYGFVDSFVTVYNDVTILYPSVQMHEIGHNIGLSHANDESNYGDESGLMGASQERVKASPKCFNAAKSWELGWYSDSHAILDVRAFVINGQYTTIIKGISEYENRGTLFTIVKIINSLDGYDYFVTFNSATNINEGTGEGANMVLVTKRPSGYAYHDSTLVARLEESQSYTIYNVYNGQNLKIHAFFINRKLSQARVIFSMQNSCTDSQDCNDLDTTTADTCNPEGNCVYTPLDCASHGATVSVEVVTNDSPEYLSWNTKHLNSDRIIWSSGYYDESFRYYLDEKCIEYGEYLLTFENTHSNETLPTNFSLSVNGVLIYSESISQEYYVENSFVICSSDEHCFDYDGCSIDNCDLTSSLCNNIISDNDQNCTNCAWFALDIVTDNYPDETSWIVSGADSNDIIVSGDPYALYTYGYNDSPTNSGRRSKPTRAGRRSKPTRMTRRALTRQTTELTISEEICLEKNFGYGFTIKDSFGDGLCCDEGDGSYVVSVDGTAIFSGGEFDNEEKMEFYLSECTHDLDCDDDNLCTTDVCMKSTSSSVCIYSQKSCEECGLNVQVVINTDRYPSETSWRISKNGVGRMRGGPYDTSLTEYNTRYCLQNGKYEFFISDASENGFIKCSDEFQCGFSIIVNDVTLVDSDGLFGKHYFLSFLLNKDDVNGNMFSILSSQATSTGSSDNKSS